MGEINENEFHSLTAKVDDIHRMLIGTSEEKEVGLVSRVRKTEADISEIKDWKQKITYFAMGMVVPASYGVFDIIKTIITQIK